MERPRLTNPAVTMENNFPTIATIPIIEKEGIVTCHNTACVTGGDDLPDFEDVDTNGGSDLEKTFLSRIDECHRVDSLLSLQKAGVLAAPHGAIIGAETGLEEIPRWASYIWIRFPLGPTHGVSLPGSRFHAEDSSSMMPMNDIKESSSSFPIQG